MLALGVVANAMIALSIDIRWVLPTLGLLLGLALPTRLLTKVFRGTIRGPGLRFSLALALTLLSLMTGGLILNTVLPWFGDSHPLAGLPILLFVDVFILTIIAVRPRSLYANDVTRGRLRALEKWLIGVTVLGVTLAVLGAVRLNNDAGGGLAEVALGVATIVAIALLVSAGRIRPGVLMFCLYGVALTVLYMTSLRGWYTTGHDIQLEFRVFSLTHASHHWSVSNGGTSYEACLSITILPQMLWELTRVATPYVFKVDYPLMFAACPLALYELSRRLLGQRLAIASVLLFISFPTFVNDMVFLNRQEVAFLFVSVIFALMLCGGHNLRMRRLIILLCIVGMVMAHYSTSYVFLVTMLVAVIGLSVSKYVVGVVATRPAHVRVGKVTKLGRSSAFGLGKRPAVFNWPLMLVCCFLVVGWSFVAARASPTFVQNLKQVSGTLIGKDFPPGKSQDVNYSLAASGNGASASSELAKYRAGLTHRLGSGRVKDGFYPSSVVAKYATPPVPTSETKPTSIGNALSKIGINPYTLNSALRSAIARVLQLLAFVAVVVLFLGWRRSARISAQYLYVAIGSLVVLIASVVLPTISVDYGLLRMFQQTLLVLAPMIIIGILILLRPLGARRSGIVACVLTGVFFFSLTGLMPQITGSYVPELNLNNAGQYYELYYTEPQEISAMLWLNTVYNKDNIVQTDSFTAGRLEAYASIPIEFE